jgi:hypothetical protein
VKGAQGFFWQWSGFVTFLVSLNNGDEKKAAVNLPDKAHGLNMGERQVCG